MSDETEKWRRVVDCYEVSSLGRVRNSGRILRPRLHSNGYLRVAIRADGWERDSYIHRLVCTAFHGPAPTPATEADHANSIRDDNRASNLRWLSVAENRARRLHARGERNGCALLKEPEVRKILASPLSESNTAIAARFGMSRRHISDIRKRKYWRHVHVD